MMKEGERFSWERRAVGGTIGAEAMSKGHEAMGVVVQSPGAVIRRVAGADAAGKHAFAIEREEVAEKIGAVGGVFVEGAHAVENARHAEVRPGFPDIDFIVRLEPIKQVLRIHSKGRGAVGEREVAGQQSGNGARGVVGVGGGVAEPVALPGQSVKIGVAGGVNLSGGVNQRREREFIEDEDDDGRELAGGVGRDPGLCRGK